MLRLQCELNSRLCGRALMRIEMDETEKADFDEIMNEFASIKAREVFFEIRIFV